MESSREASRVESRNHTVRIFGARNLKSLSTGGRDLKCALSNKIALLSFNALLDRHCSAKVKQ
jgi:hypothetical protein